MYMYVSMSVLDPLDFRRKSNASNDKASSALRPVSNVQQMPPSTFSCELCLPRNICKGRYPPFLSNGINYIVVASASVPLL